MKEEKSPAHTDRPVVALFDFDGTITTRDSLLPFLWYLYGFWGVLRIVLLAFPKIVGFLCYQSSRQDAKEALLAAAFGGLTPEELSPKAQRYVEDRLFELVQPEAIERLQWHQQQGHRCIVVSASPSLYLKYWVTGHDPLELLCSNLAVNNEGRFTGKLVGKNCWGPEKVKRIEKLLGSLDGYAVYAYGDSRGDKEMLDIADYPYFRRWC